MKQLSLVVLFLMLSVVTFSYHVVTYEDSYLVLPDTPVYYDYLSFIPDNYYQAVMNAALQNHVPVFYFARMLKVESNFNSRAVGGPNRNGSYDYGIAQFNSMYLDVFASDYGYEKFDPFDPYTAIEVSAKHLSFLYSKLGSWELAFAAYNCGLSAVRRGKIPQSTRQYVAKIMEDV